MVQAAFSFNLFVFRSPQNECLGGLGFCRRARVPTRININGIKDLIVVIITFFCLSSRVPCPVMPVFIGLIRCRILISLCYLGGG